MSSNHPANPTGDAALEKLLRVQKQKGTGRPPILVGVLAGMIGWILLASVESPSFYRLSVLVFNETSPKALFATPGYYCIHRTLLLALCAIGGGLGIALSSMRKRTAILFLFGILAVVTVFATIFPR
jgi:hypothetical protein